MISIDFDAHDLEEQMARMVRELRIAAPKIVKLEAYLLLKAVVKFTAPDSRSQGRKAVKRDITRAVTLLDPAKFENENIAKLMRKRDLPALNEIMKRVPGWKGWEVVPFDPEELHAKKRDKRGRIQRFKKKFTVEKSRWNKYVREKQDEVGSAKASWALGYQISSGSSLPGWIAAHTAEGKYTTTVSYLADSDKPRLIITTGAKGVVNDPEFRRQLSRAVQVRVQAMKNKVNRMLRDPLKYQNLFAQYQ